MTENSAIPEQLRTWCFILLSGHTKIPTAEMKGWAKDRANKTFTYDDKRFIEHITAHENYGAVTGEDRFVVAADTKEVETAIEEHLPKTFTVQSPRHKTKHFYFYGKLSRTILCKPTTEGDPCADIKTGNAYVLSAGDIFENYGKYTVIDNVPIATITEEQLLAAIDEFILPKKETRFLTITSEKHDKNLDFPITSILPNLDALTQNNDEMFGPHPLHGSTTGANFHVNTAKNVWHCFRSGHESGGGPLELFAVLNGIVNCEDCHKGVLHGELFKKTVMLAHEKGLVASISFQDSEEQEDKEHELMRKVVTGLQSQFTFKTPSDIEEIYVFNKGVYEEAETMIKGQVEQWLGTEATTHFIEEVLGHIRRSSYVKRSEFNKPSAIIPVQNGLLDLNSGEVSPFDKEQIFTFKLNMVYDKTKKSLKFLKAVHEWLNSQDVITLQEVSGYCLLPAMPFHKLFFLHGTGFNGKGSFIRTLIAIFGIDNCSNLNLEEFDGNHRFATALLYGKMINTSSEPKTDKQLQTNLLKKVCGEDYIDSEVKNKQRRIHHVSAAKPFILGNRFPRVNDNTVAFWERVTILKFPSNFIGDKQIPCIWNTWINDPDEMSGILNWMIEGLQRLIKNNKFTESKDSEETKLEFQRASDTTLAFLNECCTIDRVTQNIKSDFYDQYKTYCEKLNVEIDPENMFSAKLKQQSGVRSTRQHVEKKLEHLWVGIKFNDYPKEEGEEEKSEKSGKQKNHGTQKKLDQSVPPVPTVPPFTKSNAVEDSKGIEKRSSKRYGTPGTGGTVIESIGKTVPDVPTEISKQLEKENLTVNRCKKHRTATCPHPNRDCIAPTNSCPKTCGDFVSVEDDAKAKGAALELNGDSGRLGHD